MKTLLALLRFVVVSIITFFLLIPLLTALDVREEAPVIIFAQDVSSSLVLNKDSLYYKNRYLDQVEDLLKGLEEDFQIERYSFDGDLSQGSEEDFNGKQTDMAGMLSDLYDRNSNRNIGAVIIATDGIYNRGANPTYVAQKLQSPIHHIALGDTTIKKDVVLENVAHNRIVYSGNDFPLEALIKVDRYAGERVVLSVSKGGEVMFSRTIDVDRDGFLQNYPIQLNASEPGRQRYDISLSPLDGELSLRNNRRSIYIDVIDGRQKILVLARAPHPDLKALRESIDNNQNYEAEVVLSGRFSGDLDEYDMVVLHDLPAQGDSQKGLMAELASVKKPTLFIAGLRTDYEQLSSLGVGVSVDIKKGNTTTDASATFDQGFSLFTVSNELIGDLSKWPPLTTVFGDFSSSNSTDILMKQRIGVVDTEQALISFSELNDRKTGVISGEGIWRWRTIDHLEHGNNDRFNELISKAIQYMATKEDKRMFRVYAKDRFNEDQKVLVEAEFYNRSFEAINDPEVSIIMKNEEGDEYPYTFSRSRNGYLLDAGRLPVGDYTYRATTSLDGEVFTASGGFAVIAMQMESMNTTADHQLLYSISENTGGLMVLPAEMARIAERIRTTDDIVTVRYSTKTLSDLIDMKWIFFLIMGLLSLEWFIRKYNGAY